MYIYLNEIEAKSVKIKLTITSTMGNLKILN